MNEKIFIQIASYRDPELLPTIKDCLENAEHPESLVFSINWQHSKEDEWDNLAEYLADPRFKIIDMDYTMSKGTCWARNLLQQQYDGEEYTLCIDSHHRFIKHWDTVLKNFNKDLKEQGFKKPILTAYPPSYNPETYPKDAQYKAWQTNFNKFDKNGIISMIPGALYDPSSPTPLRGRFYSAGFAFADGIFVKEVPHDPNLYFLGEEMNITVRAFTWGYDFFTPPHPIVWHEYMRKTKSKHWLDNKKWHELNRQSVDRYHRLFDVDQSKIIHSEPYGFGPHRSIKEYCNYAGISLKRQKVQEYTMQHLPPPNPSAKEETFNYPLEEDETKKKRYTPFIKINRSFFKEDFTFCAMIFKNKNGKGISRRDVKYNEINKKLKNSNNTNILLWGDFESTTKPYSWILWLYSKEKGWLEKTTGMVKPQEKKK